MISYLKKIIDIKPATPQAEDNRFEQIRKKSAEMHKKSDTSGAARRARQTTEDNRLI